MVDFRTKLNIDFDLSDKQIEILDRNNDTLVRAIPGSGKTTILTLKVKNLLIDNPQIKQMCCISYTNVNVEDLEYACSRIIDAELIRKLDFLTFHRFCLQYILTPYSYLYRSNKGLRAYKKIFNFTENSENLIQYLKVQGIDESEIKKIQKAESVYYNFEFINSQWRPISNSLQQKTLINYLNFLKKEMLIDFNLINLLSLFIIQENKIVRVALNKAIDWIFIDEFQDVTEIQCKIIEELRKNRISQDCELKWFIVGDPNQSIYGFAGANPRSMYDIKQVFNNLNTDNCEIKLDKTYRCSNQVFEFARKNYNETLNKIKGHRAITELNDVKLINYLEDIVISEEVLGNGKDGEIITKNTLSGVEEIVNLKFTELVEDEVCCIGINRYNSIDVYKQYKLQANLEDGEDFSLYSDLYKEFEDKYGFKYFSLFIRYLIMKNYFYYNRIKFPYSTNKFIYILSLLLAEKITDEAITESKILKITIDAGEFTSPLNPSSQVTNEFFIFSKRLINSLQNNFPEQKELFIVIDKNNKVNNFNSLTEPNIQGFINYTKRINKEKVTFEIKHIHKIKGLEYNQVIVQKIEELPYKAGQNKVHQVIFGNQSVTLTASEVYNYIQELNKLYVMLTRSKKNLYIIINENKLPALLSLDFINI